MDLRRLRSFVAVAEEMHVGRTAERLHVAPTDLSRLVEALEDEIGVHLPTRATRAVLIGALRRSASAFDPSIVLAASISRIAAHAKSG